MDFGRHSTCVVGSPIVMPCTEIVVCTFFEIKLLVKLIMVEWVGRQITPKIPANIFVFISRCLMWPKMEILGISSITNYDVESNMPSILFISLSLV